MSWLDFEENVIDALISIIRLFKHISNITKQWKVKYKQLWKVWALRAHRHTSPDAWHLHYRLTAESLLTVFLQPRPGDVTSPRRIISRCEELYTLALKILYILVSLNYCLTCSALLELQSIYNGLERKWSYRLDEHPHTFTIHQKRAELRFDTWCTPMSPLVWLNNRNTDHCEPDCFVALR